MSTRKNVFVNGEFYHVYNRGVDKRSIFNDRDDTRRFFQSMVEFNTADPIGSLYENSFRQLGGPTPKLAETPERLVNVVAYCLNQNHFHLILEQVIDSGISEFMKRLGGGYTGYFNNKHERSGSLFQGKFKSVHVDSNAYLLHLSAYVNLNDRAHQLGGPTPKLMESLSSWGEYSGERKGGDGICKKDVVLDQFSSTREYVAFALSSLETIIEKKEDMRELDRLLLE